MKASELSITIDRRLFHPEGGGRDALWHFLEAAFPLMGGDPNAHSFKPARYLHALCSDVFQPFIMNRRGVSPAWATWTLLNIPPSHTKSLLANVVLPVWAWGPATQAVHAFGHLSYEKSLVMRDAYKCRTLLRDERFLRRWPSAELVRGNEAKGWYTNKSGGYRACGTIREGIIGKHFNSILLDDPQDPMKLSIGETSDAASEAEKAREVIDTVLPSRVLDEETRFMCIMQRLSQIDVSQHLIDKYSGQADDAA